MLDLDLILKNNELCLVGQPRGRVTREQSGLYVRDTRFLDRLDVTFAGRLLRVLEVQTPSPNQVVITATNPELDIDGVSVPGHTVLFRVDIRLTSVVTCTVRVQSFARVAISGDLEIAAGADFRDMFHVRGSVPARPAMPRPPVIDGATAMLSAEGSDGAMISTRLTVPAGASIEPLDDAPRGPALMVRAPLTLQTGDATDVTVTIEPRPVGAPLMDASSQEEDAGFRPQFRISSPAQQLDAFIRQCDADLALLQTTFPDGNIPAAGIPWYIAPFGRDSLIVALQTMHLYPVRSEHTLRLLAALQGTKHDPFREEAPGKILHEMRYGDMARTGQIPHTPYYGSIDSTPLFVMTFARHYLWHRDDALYDALIGNVRRALDWIETDGDPDGDGLLEFAGEQIDFTHISQQGWKDSGDSLNFADGRPVRGPIALVEVQGYAFAAYDWLAKAVRLRGDNAWAEELGTRAATIRERVEDLFWMEEEQYYAQALDGEKQPVDAISSNPGHLLFCGLPGQERADAVARRMAHPDMNSGWGIRTLSSQMATYNPMSYHNGSVWPHDVSLTMFGLDRYGHRALAREQALVITELAAHDPELRIAELYCGFGRDETPTSPINYPESCLPQAWAAGAGIAAISILLGVRIDDAGTFGIEPNLPPTWSGAEAHGFRSLGETYGVRIEVQESGTTVHVDKA